MIIKLSDYIMEQTISTASVDDIEMEQVKAEIEVTSAICEAYFKQLDMMMFMEMDGTETDNTEMRDAVFNRLVAANQAKKSSEEPLPSAKARSVSGLQNSEGTETREGKILGSAERPVGKFEDVNDGMSDELSNQNDRLPQGKQFKDKKDVTKTSADKRSGVYSRMSDELSNQNDRLKKGQQFGSKDDKLAETSKGVGAFFKSIGSWFVKIWTQFIGWISEKRLNSIINKLKKMSAENRAKMQVKVPRKLFTSTYSGQQEADNVQFLVETGSKFMNILKAFKEKTGYTGADVNYIVKEVDDFRYELKSHRKFYDNADAKDDVTIDGEKFLAMLEGISKSFNSKKSEFEKLKQDLTANKNIGDDIAKAVNFTDAKAGKTIYKSIKSAYSMYSTYMAYQMTSFVKILNETNFKSEMKNPSGTSGTGKEEFAFNDDKGKPLGSGDLRSVASEIISEAIGYGYGGGDKGVVYADSPEGKELIAKLTPICEKHKWPTDLRKFSLFMWSDEMADYLKDNYISFIKELQDAGVKLDFSKAMKTMKEAYVKEEHGDPAKFKNWMLALFDKSHIKGINEDSLKEVGIVLESYVGDTVNTFDSYFG